MTPMLYQIWRGSALSVARVIVGLLEIKRQTVKHIFVEDIAAGHMAAIKVAHRSKIRVVAPIDGQRGVALRRSDDIWSTYYKSKRFSPSLKANHQVW